MPGWGEQVTRRSRLPSLLARARMPGVVLAVLLLVFGPRAGVPFAFSFALFVLAMLIYLRIGVVRRDPVVIRPPVRGRWRAVHSPADRVPSHGVLAYGQSHAVDLVHEPAGTPRTRYGGWRLAGVVPGAFPGFGQVVFSPAAGVVVTARDGQRDHRARTSWPQLLLLFAESTVRELGGARRILGNHVVLRLPTGEYVALAHLRKGSLRVREGDTVGAGQPVAECGNSGNSSEPHLHLQVMDHRRPWFAAGLPLAFEEAGPSPDAGRGEATAGVPTGHEPVVWEQRPR